MVEATERQRCTREEEIIGNTYEAWLPLISHKIFGFFILLLSWEVLFSSSSSQKLKNF